MTDANLVELLEKRQAIQDRIRELQLEAQDPRTSRERRRAIHEEINAELVPPKRILSRMIWRKSAGRSPEMQHQYRRYFMRAAAEMLGDAVFKQIERRAEEMLREASGVEDHE